MKKLGVNVEGDFDTRSALDEWISTRNELK